MISTFTTTISSETLEWLRKNAKEQKKTVRSLLEEAISAYQVQEKKERLKASFMRAQQDAEMGTIAEEHLDDAQEQFNSYQQL